MPEEPAAGILFLLNEASLQDSSEVYWKDCQPKRASRSAQDPAMGGMFEIEGDGVALVQERLALAMVSLFGRSTRLGCCAAAPSRGMSRRASGSTS